MSELKVIEFPKQERDEPTVENLMATVKEFFDGLDHVPDICVMGTYHIESDTLVHGAFRSSEDAEFRGLQQLGMIEMMKQATIARNFHSPEAE